MQKIQTEVLVIGSGFGAAAPALRLSQAGFEVLIIEKGKNIVPEKDFKQTQDPKYLLQYLKGMSSNTVSFTYAEALGGGSGFYEMISLRAPSLVFEQVDRNRKRLWPSGVDHRTLDPFYEMAERMLQVEQIAEEEIPKTGVVFSVLMKNLGYSCDRARYAVKGCIGSGYCVSGCVFGAKQSLHYNYLPQAKQAGAQVLTDIEALSIKPLESNLESTKACRSVSALPYRYLIHCRSKNGEELTIQSKIVILGCGTVGTAKLLLSSRAYLTSLSEQVGKNIAFNGSVKVAGLLPEGFIEGDMLSGRSHPGVISYQFLESMGITISAAKPLPLQLVSAAHLILEGEKRNPAHWGEANVELMKLYRRKMIVLYALGLTPPSAEIREISQNNYKPYLGVGNELSTYYQRVKTLLQAILTKNGCKIIQAHAINREGEEYEDIHFSTSHMVGSCRMAEKRRDGVVDVYGEVFNYPGLYVTDGAAIPSSLAVNSSLTILANAERIAHQLTKWYIKSDVVQAQVN